MGLKFKDCMGQVVLVGDQIAVATMCNKRANMRVGLVTSMNPETGIVAVRLDNGTYYKDHGTRNTLVLGRGRATRAVE